MRIAVIGLGERTTWLVQRLLALYPQVRLAGVFDFAVDQIPVRLNRLGLSADSVRVFKSLDDLLDNVDGFDAAMIGTRCSSHAPIAIRLAPSGLPIFLEKPIATSWDQLVALARAYRGREHRVVVSFPLRRSELFLRVMAFLKSGALGRLNQIQAINNVPYGGVYFAQWYRSFSETGGLWLQKATHDFDYIHALAGSAPETIVAVGSRTIFGGDMPDDLKCSQCNRTETCMESPQNIERRGDHGGMGTGDHSCAFSRSIRHHDSGSAIVRYADGMHASYSQNFVTRRSAERRGAIVTGYSATLEFDWYQSTARVIHHHTDKVEQFESPPRDGHAGGDDDLLRNFVEVVEGRAEAESNLHHGILSVATCLAAQRSEAHQAVERVLLPESQMAMDADQIAAGTTTAMNGGNGR